jgi:hypothetical protein
LSRSNAECRNQEKPHTTTITGQHVAEGQQVALRKSALTVWLLTNQWKDAFTFDGLVCGQSHFNPCSFTETWLALCDITGIFTALKYPSPPSPKALHIFITFNEYHQLILLICVPVLNYFTASIVISITRTKWR